MGGHRGSGYNMMEYGSLNTNWCEQDRSVLERVLQEDIADNATFQVEEQVCAQDLSKEESGNSDSVCDMDPPSLINVIYSESTGECCSLLFWYHVLFVGIYPIAMDSWRNGMVIYRILFLCYFSWSSLTLQDCTVKRWREIAIILRIDGFGLANRIYDTVWQQTQDYHSRMQNSVN